MFFLIDAIRITQQDLFIDFSWKNQMQPPSGIFLFKITDLGLHFNSWAQIWIFNIEKRKFLNCYYWVE